MAKQIVAFIEDCGIHRRKQHLQTIHVRFQETPFNWNTLMKNVTISRAQWNYLSYIHWLLKSVWHCWPLCKLHKLGLSYSASTLMLSYMIENNLFRLMTNNLTEKMSFLEFLKDQLWDRSFSICIHLIYKTTLMEVIHIVSFVTQRFSTTKDVIQLGWLPMKQKIDFSIMKLAYKSIHNAKAFQAIW